MRDLLIVELAEKVKTKDGKLEIKKIYHDIEKNEVIAISKITEGKIEGECYKQARFTLSDSPVVNIRNVVNKVASNDEDLQKFEKDYESKAHKCLFDSRIGLTKYFTNPPQQLFIEFLYDHSNENQRNHLTKEEPQPHMLIQAPSWAEKARKQLPACHRVGMSSSDEPRQVATAEPRMDKTHLALAGGAVLFGMFALKVASQFGTFSNATPKP